MGTVDAFSKEDRVEVKFSDFYNLMKEATKAELILNAVNCNVPHGYIREMATGKEENEEIYIKGPYGNVLREIQTVNMREAMPHTKEHPEQIIGKCDENGKITELFGVPIDTPRETEEAQEEKAVEADATDQAESEG